ncbi:hypothetical protein BAE44_0000448 [Dichanthelium oligosanthes]|uniref:Uncharacterized protein n=1 Tax=Dichanthelium oligosanthes TaxID=888268 RepID=A0A1E5WMD4_9POAL|nr:hypothetical protein BAE44_0000448 [Dichanthelium oligosanthes]
MGHRKSNHHKGRGEAAHEKQNRCLARACCPCFVLGSVVRGIGRCLFVACYPMIQCCGLDECRHHHTSHLSHFR